MLIKHPPHIEKNVVTDDGVTIRFKTLGEGLPMVCSNGLGVNTSLWSLMEHYFHTACQFITWDYRGHGNSSVPEDLNSITMERHCRDLKTVLDSLGIKQAVHLGHSMGVQVILEYCHMFPQDVIGLIPICGSYKNPLESFFYINWPREVLLPLFNATEVIYPAIYEGVRQLAPTWLAETTAMLIGCNGHLINREDFKPYLYNMSMTNTRVFTYALRAIAEHSAEDYLENIMAPTLIIAGEMDYFTPSHLSTEMNETMPRSELYILKKGSHVALLDVPELIHLRIEKYLREHFGITIPVQAKEEILAGFDDC